MRKYQKFSKILTLSLFCLSQIPLNTNVLGESTVPENGAKGKLVVKKTDDQNKPLSKATFVLKTTAHPESKIEKVTAELTGEATFDNLIPGDYTLSEETAPEGYKKTNQTWQVKVESNGKTTIQNSGDKNSTIGQNQEELDKQYPPTGIYEDTKESYKLEHVKGSVPNGKSEAKAVNPYSSEGEHIREIPEGTLSKRISEVGDLAHNKYKIELTVSGKTIVKPVDKQKPLDVVFILDNSNSMNNDGPNFQRHNKAKKAAEALGTAVKDILGANSDNRVALVTYGSDIFDGRSVDVVKGFKEDDKYYGLQTKFTIQTENYSHKQLINNAEEIIKRIPTEAPKAKWGSTTNGLTPEQQKEYYLSKVGETFTMKAFMEADDILSQVNRNSQKIIVHVTDGVPTRSYAINNFKLGASYESQFEQMKKNGYLNKSNFLLTDKPDDIKGNGESYFLFPLDSYQTQIISGNLQKLHYLDLNLNYPKGTIYRNGPVKEHGTPTKLYINSLKQKNYDIFNFGIDISGFRQVYNEEYKKNQDGTFQKLKEEAFKLSDGEITELMRSFSSKPEYYTPIVTSADTSNNEILSKIQQQFETILTKENSIVNGTIEDPMGDKINLQLGNGQILQPSDYTLQGNDGSVMKDGIATGGPNNDGGILKGVKLEYIGNKLYVRGLNLGEGQKVTLTYDVKLDDSFISNKFYDTNGRTTLNPKSEDPNTLRDFPIPKIRDVREYPTITIKNEKKLGEIEFIKVDKDNNKLLLKGATFELQEFNEDYKLYLPIKNNNSKVVTGENGKISYKDLKDGKYQLIEAVSPEDYQKITNKPILTFEVVKGSIKNIIAVNKQISEYHEEGDKHLITNTHIPPKGIIPKTGGKGILSFILIGGAMMSIAGGIYIWKRYKKSSDMSIKKD
ncbi:PI-2a pilus adhesin PilA [Streptococcus agalactiae]|uniref:PI-2a pilus adhesin PilA n=1 Tax=Streptococcus agalactiae TaxID=1311 RepID=UPI00064016E3|nr:PI-2a pilus adhesin PilA [Streptococcus agalactiae]KLK52734.1 cell surface protein [Streptococcus agalactiae]